jgi:hypothetical protein
MKKRILDIQLAKIPSSRYNKREYQSDSSGFHHRAKRVIIVNAKMLLETFCNQMCLMSLNGSISAMLEFKDLLAIYHVATGLRLDQCPSPILL